MDHEQRRALTSRVSERLRQTLPACVGLVLFLLALEVLRLELRSVSWHELRTDVLDVPPWRFALAILLTALNYLTLTGYDLLAFRYIGKTMPRARIALGLVSRLRRREQCWLCHAVGRVRALSLLYPLGR